MPADLLDSRHLPTIEPEAFFAARHAREPSLRAARDEIASARRAALAEGLLPDAPDPVRAAAIGRSDQHVPWRWIAAVGLVGLGLLRLVSRFRGADRARH